jgi:antirestriction protein
MPDHLAGYFDYEKFARDLFIDDVHGHRVNGYLHVFLRNW